MNSSRYLATLFAILCLGAGNLLAQSYDGLIDQGMQLRNAGQFADAGLPPSCLRAFGTEPGSVAFGDSASELLSITPPVHQA